MSSNSINPKMKKKKELKDTFDNEFLISKDLALQPITFFYESNSNLEEMPIKERHLSLKSKRVEKNKKSDRSRKSEKSNKSQKSQKSQKSTSNTNKKTDKRKSMTQIYSSNIVIINNDDDEENDNSSSADPIEKEVAKLKKLISKSKEKKKKRNSKSRRTNTNGSGSK